MNNVIDINSKHAELMLRDLADAVGFINSLDSKLANDVLAALMAVVMYQCRVGLGLIEEDDEPSLGFFHRIDELYQEAAGACYFCRKDIDPNEVKVDENTKLCMFCRIKLNNVQQNLSILGIREVRK